MKILQFWRCPTMVGHTVYSTTMLRAIMLPQKRLDSWIRFLWKGDAIIFSATLWYFPIKFQFQIRFVLFGSFCLFFSAWKNIEITFFKIQFDSSVRFRFVTSLLIHSEPNLLYPGRTNTSKELILSSIITSSKPMPVLDSYLITFSTNNFSLRRTTLFHVS